MGLVVSFLPSLPSAFVHPPMLRWIIEYQLLMNRLRFVARPSGYHGDDGRVFECSGTGKPFGPQFSTNDVVGCGIDFTQKGRVFFTKNGEMIGEIVARSH